MPSLVTKTKLSAKTKTIIALAALGVAFAGFAGFQAYKQYKEKQRQKLLTAKPDYTKQLNFQPVYKNNKLIDTDVLVDTDFYSKTILPESVIKQIIDKVNNEFLVPKSNQKVQLRNITYLARNKKSYWASLYSSTDSYPGLYFSQDSFKSKNIPELLIIFSKLDDSGGKNIEDSINPVNSFVYPAKYYASGSADESYKIKLSNFCSEFPAFTGANFDAEQSNLLSIVTYPWGASSEKAEKYPFNLVNLGPSIPEENKYKNDPIYFASAMITHGILVSIVKNAEALYFCGTTEDIKNINFQENANLCPKVFDEFKNSWKACP